MFPLADLSTIFILVQLTAMSDHGAHGLLALFYAVEEAKIGQGTGTSNFINLKTT